MKNNIIWVLIRNTTPRAGRKSYPDLGAPVQWIHWLTNMERSWQYNDEKYAIYCILHWAPASIGRALRVWFPPLVTTEKIVAAQKIWIAADDTRMLDAIVIYNVLFSELRPKLGGYAEIETDFWRREMIAILELGAYLSANKIVQQIWIVAYNTTMTKDLRSSYTAIYYTNSIAGMHFWHRKAPIWYFSKTRSQ